MYTIYPTIFPDFQCKAGACKHTCCQTWEIDIDPDTEEKYRSTKGPLGEELARWMRTAEDGSTCFKLNEKGYCHFLRDDGLCRLILEKGEDYLGNICTMHPRFYKYIDDVELCGTGLCCEKTCEDLSRMKGPLLFAIEGEDTVMDFPALTSALGWDIPEALFSFTPRLEEAHFREILSHLESTDPIDKEWTEHLSFLSHHPEAALDAARRYEAPRDFFNRLYHYIWYRQLDLALFTDMADLAAYAEESALYIYIESALTGDPLRAVARWSEQIEYDTDNVSLLLGFLSQ
jgi:lysine-N-methylase